MSSVREGVVEGNQERRIGKMNRWSAWTDNHGVGLINVSAWPYTLTADKTYAWKVRLCIVDKKDKIQKIARRVLPKL